MEKDNIIILPWFKDGELTWIPSETTCHFTQDGGQWHSPLLLYRWLSMSRPQVRIKLQNDFMGLVQMCMKCASPDTRRVALTGAAT